MKIFVIALKMAIRNLVVIVLVIVFCTILFTMMSVKYEYNNEEYISIHLGENKRLLQERYSFPVEGENNIIFIESSCVVEVSENDYKRFRLNKRQACSIESAVKNNPHANVYLMYTCPVTSLLVASHVQALFAYSNFFLWPVHPSEFFKGTPLDEWYHGGALKKSKWPAFHGSDVLGLVTLWKVGGVYLDLDVIVLKSFDDLPRNFVGIEKPYLGNNVISIESRGIGRRMSQMCVDEVRNNFRGDIWAHNGPQLLNRVLKTICNTNNLKNTTTEGCHGVTILPAKSFYPLRFEGYNNYFDEKNCTSTLDSLKDSYGVHLWSLISGKRDVNTEIRSPFVVMAKENCPKVFRAFGKVLHIVHTGLGR